MFQNLASYLLGGTTTTIDSSIAAAGGVEESNNRVALRTSEHDDGWTMVDRDSEGNSDAYSSEEDDVSEGGLERVRLERAASDESLVRVQVHDMEESWFVTPPPCFSSQTGPVQLRTSPLENLLIEHPSMSVYQRNGCRHPHFRTPTPTPELETEEVVMEEEEQEAEEGGAPMVVVVRRRDATAAQRHRCNRLHALQLTEAQIVKNREAQKVQMKKTAQKAARGFLNRSNKAREVNGRNWNPRRKERCQGGARSHANNNRKC